MHLSYFELDTISGALAAHAAHLEALLAIGGHEAPQLLEEQVSELRGVRAKLTAELDRRFAAQDAARARGASEEEAARELELDRSPAMEAPMRAPT